MYRIRKSIDFFPRFEGLVESDKPSLTHSHVMNGTNKKKLSMLVKA